MQVRTNPQPTRLRLALIGALGALLCLAGGAKRASAVTFQEVLWLAGDYADARRNLGLDEPALGPLAAYLGQSWEDTREHRIPLITPGVIAFTPAPAGSDVRCLGLLAAEGQRLAEGPPTEGIATPVRIPEEGIGGVRYRYFYKGKAPRIIDCRLALALARAAPVLRANGVVEVIFLNHYRPSYGQFKPGHYNFHSQGLAIDVWGFRTRSGLNLVVRRDYETGLGFADPHSCLGQPMTVKGMLLRKIACDLDASDAFKAILTPDFDAQHWHHFHISTFHPLQLSRLRPRGTALLEVPITDLTSWALTRSTRQRPELRRWDEVAAQPWPERFRGIRQKVGLAPEPSDAELAADLLRGPSPVGQVWTAFVGLLDLLTPVVEDNRDALEPALEELSALID